MAKRVAAGLASAVLVSHTNAFVAPSVSAARGAAASHVEQSQPAALRGAGAAASSASYGSCGAVAGVVGVVAIAAQRSARASARSSRAQRVVACKAAKVGDSIPAVSLDDGFPPEPFKLADYCKGKKVVLVGLPGAFTPT